ncbi:MAG: S8 family serine peptidase [FCB group bacterium]|nr:S8 family serine peptidase [FCB group bacterium]MBL7028454.1 S8 family serine peptidase [Candidatus Neomarinimicrobiota bacterium]MBL7122368.1 S8 family serine peptidase [Candidatus Neomarinimicrobiota bacterium]
MLGKRFILLLLFVSTLSAGETHLWIFLESDPSSTPVQLTPRAVERLRQRGSANTLGSSSVSESQLAQLRAAGYKIRHASRFLNAVSVVIENDVQLSSLQNFSFVKSTSPVGRAPRERNEETFQANLLERGSSMSYGASAGQNEMLNIPQIHSLGYDGSGVMIGVFDTGFLTDHPVFEGIDIEAQYDFIDHEVDASGLGHEHGINVLSALGGHYPGELIGPAYKATFLLARTEDDYSESREEEDNWVAAMEWADSLGVDIISSSLNYFQDFDDPNEDYPLSALDGQTTITARAANIAADRGILVVNSAGNEGSSPSSIWPPADSPHVLSVGAISPQGEISYFSGRGPTYDGRIKPDVVAQGSLVYMASGVNGFIRGNGTSFSTPLIAGLSALLLQAQPHLTPDSIISLFQNHGDRSSAPDNSYGWGIPDLTSLFSKLKTGNSKNCLVYPNPGHAGEIRMILSESVPELPDQATLYDIWGREIATLSMTQESGSVIKISIPSSLNLANQLIIISVETDIRCYSGKFILLR